jgi:hypothetical protein
MLVSPHSTSPYAFGDSDIPYRLELNLITNTDMSTEMKKFEFTIAEKTIARTYFVEGKCTFADDYETSTGLKGIAFEIEGIPYKLRVLCGSISNGSKAKHFIGSTLKFTGIDREYNGKMYFSPKDCCVVERDVYSELAIRGIAYTGSLD